MMKYLIGVGILLGLGYAAERERCLPQQRAFESTLRAVDSFVMVSEHYPVSLPAFAATLQVANHQHTHFQSVCRMWIGLGRHEYVRTLTALLGSAEDIYQQLRQLEPDWKPPSEA